MVNIYTEICQSCA